MLRGLEWARIACRGRWGEGYEKKKKKKKNRLCLNSKALCKNIIRVLDIMFCQIKSKNSSVYKPGIFSLARLKLLEKNNVFWREDVFWTEGPEWPPYVFGVFQSVRDAMVVEDARGDRK